MATHSLMKLPLVLVAVEALLAAVHAGTCHCCNTNYCSVEYQGTARSQSGCANSFPACSSCAGGTGSCSYDSSSSYSTPTPTPTPNQFVDQFASEFEEGYCTTEQTDCLQDAGCMDALQRFATAYVMQVLQDCSDAVLSSEEAFMECVVKALEDTKDPCCDNNQCADLCTRIISPVPP
eukprot:COSAG05_NODE_8103_length_735_cov_3.496855_1_plen_177_part_10